MIYCNRHRPLVPYGTNDRACVTCGQDCGPPGDMCTGCALKAETCRVCHTPVNTGRSSVELLAVIEAEMARDRTISCAEQNRRAVLDPIAEQVAVYLSEIEAANAPYLAARAKLTELEQPTLDRYKVTTRCGGQAFENARTALIELRAKHDEQVAPERATAEAGCALAEAKFAMHKAAWETAESTFRTIKWRAERLCAASIERLAGHLAVENAFRAQCEAINS